MRAENEELQGTPEHDELQAMLHKMVNVPIQQHIEQLMSTIGQDLQDTLEYVKPIRLLVKGAKDGAIRAHEAHEAHENFVEWAQRVQEARQDSSHNWAEEVRQHWEEASKLAKSNAADMDATVKALYHAQADWGEQQKVWQEESKLRAQAHMTAALRSLRIMLAGTMALAGISLGVVVMLAIRLLS